MPKLNGYDACKLIKAQPALQDIPVLFLTVRGDQNEKQTGFAAGAVAYLVKPFASSELVYCVSDILSRGKVH
jgi:putative two-component system response regulator